MLSFFCAIYRVGRKNSHFSEFKYSWPNLLKSSQQLKQLSFSHRVSPVVSAGQCLIHHLLQCSPICFSRTERLHIVHATLLLTCAQMCPSSLNRKTGRQAARILIRLIMQFMGVAADGVSSQNFTHWPAETCAYRLLGSAKPGHIESSDRSAAKKTNDGHQGKGCPRGVSSGLTLWENDSCFTVCQCKLSKIHVFWSYIA